MNLIEQTHIMQRYASHARIQRRPKAEDDLFVPGAWSNLPKRQSGQPDELFDFRHYEYRERLADGRWWSVYDTQTETLATWHGSAPQAAERAAEQNIDAGEPRYRPVLVEITDVSPR